LKLFSGVIFDHTRRAKPWIVFGYSLAGFGRPLIALVTSWPLLLAIRFADRVGKGSGPRPATPCSPKAPGWRGGGWPSACTGRWTTPGRWSDR
jgi:hypothetical protein